jgi:hypothetical protein
MGLVLAIIGLYGVTSFLMVQRKPEVGIRMALGASKGDIVRLVLASAMRIVLPGTIAGLTLALGISQALSSLLFKVGPHDAAIFVGSTMLLVTVTVIASLIPAIAATRVDPNYYVASGLIRMYQIATLQASFTADSLNVSCRQIAISLTERCRALLTTIRRLRASDRQTGMYGPPPYCKRKDEEGGIGLRECIRPLLE